MQPSASMYPLNSTSSDGVTDAELTTFQVDDDDILLQHTYVILLGLEKQKAQAWFDATAKPTTTSKVVKNTTQKLRV